MKVNPLLFAVLHGFFLMEASAVANYLPMAEQMREGKFKAADWFEAGASNEEPSAFFAITSHATDLGVLGYASLNEVPAGSVAVHTISGPMMEDDSCWSIGTRTLGQRIQAADAHENIVAHVARWNTPGGSTSGLESFANIIAGTQKPFVSHAQQMCSAGYWAGSGSDAIVVNGRTAMIGSIGTMVSFRDYSKANEKAGYVDHTINATASTNKNEAFAQAQKGNYKPIRAQLLDPLNEVFLSTVRENRAGKLDAQQETELLSGMVYIGQTNVENGLADQMGTFDEAVALALQLAEEAASSATSAAKPATKSTNHTMSLFAKKTLTLGAAMLALVAKDSVSAEEATAANQELETANIKGAKLITEAAFNELEAKADRTDAAEQLATEANAKVTALEANNTKLTNDLKAETARANGLAKLPGANHTEAVRKEGESDVDEPSDAAASQKLVDELHTKMLG